MAKAWVLAVAAAGCGRLNFEPVIGADDCPGDNCDLGPWLPVGGSHGFASDQRLSWSSDHGGGVSNFNQFRDNEANAADLMVAPAHVSVADGPSPLVVSTSGTGDVVFMRWDGTEWSQALPPVKRGVPADTLRVALDTNAQHPVVAYNEASVGFVARRFDGTAWLELGASIAAATVFQRDMGIALGVNAEPVFAWVDAGAVYVRRFSGASWTAMGSGSDAGAGLGDAGRTASSVRLAGGAAPGAAPTVVWLDQRTGTNQVYLRQWDGTAWSGLGGSEATALSTGAVIAEPAVAHDAAGRPIVAWRGRNASTVDQLYVRRWNGTAWVDLGAGSSSAGGVSNATAAVRLAQLVAFAPDRFAVSWRVDRQAYVATWDGGSWRTTAPLVLPQPSTSGIVGASPAGTPCFAWPETGIRGGNVFLRCFDGVAWVPLGPAPVAVPSISATNTKSSQVALAFDPNGHLDVMWVEDANPMSGLTSALYSKVLVDDAWRERAQGTASGSGLTGLDTVFHPMLMPGAEPTAFWVQGYAALMVRRWNGTSWAELSPGSATSGVDHGSLSDIRHPTAIVGPDGAPWVAFQDHCIEWNIYVLRFAASEWPWVGGESCTTRGASDLDFADVPRMVRDLDDGVVLAYAGTGAAGPREVFVRRWSGTAWADLGGAGGGGGVSANGVDATQPSIAIDGLGRLWVAWSGASGSSSQIYVRVFEQGAWTERAGSGSGSGISGTSGPSTKPIIVIDGRNQPIVVWSDASHGAAEIYARRWNGALWQQLSGSGSGGGISNSSGPSLDPAAAIHDDTVCVAWSEPLKDSTDIVGRCLRLGR